MSKQDDKKLLSPFAATFGPEVCDRRLGNGEFRALLLMRLLAGPDAKLHASVELLAGLLGISIRTTQIHKKALAGAGAIIVNRGAGPRGTDVVTVVDPMERYGREPMSDFFQEVQRVSQDRLRRNRDTSRCGGKGAQNPAPPTKPAPEPPQFSASRGAGSCTQSRSQGSDQLGVDRRHTATTEPATQDVPSVPTGTSSSASSVPDRRRARHRSVIPIFDPAKRVSDWAADDMAAYFIEQFRRKWHGEAPGRYTPQVATDLAHRLAWLANEGVPPDMARRAIDYAIANWDALRSRLKGWSASRPDWPLLAWQRPFEQLVREVQQGPQASGGRADFWSADGASALPTVGWGDIGERPTNDGLNGTA